MGGLGSRWSAAGTIHSGRDDDMRGRRSLSLSSSNSRRSVIDDGRHSSAVMSLTGIFRWERGDFTDARGCAREMARELRREWRQKAEGKTVARPQDIYRWQPTNG